MAIMKITCPECGAGLKSPDGFEVGQEVECPKCESTFEVEKPVAARTTALSPSKTKSLSQKTSRLAADEDEDRPRKKKKKKKQEDEEEWSYKNSWIRYAILGVLFVVMGVLGYMLYEKRKREKEEAGAPPAPVPEDSGMGKGAPPPNMKGLGGGPNAKGNFGGPKGGNKGGPVVGTNPPNTGFVPKQGGTAPGSPFGALGGFGSAGLSPDDKEKKKQAFTQTLLGTWRADLGGGATQTVAYTKDGKFTETVTGPGARETSGTWQVSDLLGTKGLYLSRTGGGAREVKATFEGDELIHETGETGVSAVFRKK